MGRTLDRRIFTCYDIGDPFLFPSLGKWALPCRLAAGRMVIIPRFVAGVLLALASPAFGNPNRMNEGQLADCFPAGNCGTMGGHGAPAAGNALTATGKADGGTYTPGEAINLAIAGNGQYTLAGYAGGAVLGRSDGAPTTVTAPAAGNLQLIGLRAGGAGQGVTYDAWA